jgi:CheY-like chemotaxis protein
VISDLFMPEMDGFELIAYLLEQRPGLPIMVMTAYGTPANEARIKALPISHYLRKPLNLELLKDKMIEELDKNIEGQIVGFSLASFIQLAELYRRTCTLIISSGNGISKGKLYFKEGAIIAAETSDLRGEEAAYSILAWQDVSILIENKCKKDVVEISSSNINIVLNAEKMLEEMSIQNQQNTDAEIPQKIKVLSEYMEQSSVFSGYKIFNAAHELVLSPNPISCNSESALLNSFKSLWQLSDSQTGPPQFLMISASNGKRIIYFELEGYGIMSDLGLGKMPNDFINFIHPVLAEI